MARASGLPFVQWVGIRRVVPMFIRFASPGLRGFFAEVEATRMQGRSGELSLEENRNLCVLDGIFSVGYAIILGLFGMGIYYVAFDLLGASGDEIYSDLLILAIIPFLATAAVEVIDFTRISLISFLFGNYRNPQLMGPVLYVLSFMFALVFIFCFFFVW